MESQRRNKRTWPEIMADVNRVHRQILERTGRPLDVDADIAELRGLRGEPRPPMSPHELQEWCASLEALHEEMRSRPDWEDIDVVEELHAIREERLARFDTPD